MTDFYLDTNLIVRLVMHDDAALAERAETIFEEAGHGQVLHLTPMVVAEAVFVFTGRYGLTRTETVKALRGVFDLPGVKVEQASVQHRMLELYEHHPKLHLVDSYLLSRAEEEHRGVASFDDKIAKMGLVPVVGRELGRQVEEDQS